MKVGVYRNSYRSGQAETDEVRDRIRRVRKCHPEYNAKELSMVCFCGKNVVERCLQADRKVS